MSAKTAWNTLFESTLQLTHFKWTWTQNSTFSNQQLWIAENPFQAISRLHFIIIIILQFIIDYYASSLRISKVTPIKIYLYWKLTQWSSYILHLCRFNLILSFQLNGFDKGNTGNNWQTARAKTLITLVKFEMFFFWCRIISKQNLCCRS